MASKDRLADRYSTFGPIKELHMTVREILEEFWRREDCEMEKIEHEAFWEDIQKILSRHE
jgi:hypothetical protein